MCLRTRSISNLNIKFNEIKTGYILCNSDIPIPCSNLFVCEISTLDLECPFIKGT